MDPVLPEVKPDPPIETVTTHRIPDPVTSSERETYEARIRELVEQVESLELRISELENPPEPIKKKGFLDDWLP